MNEASKQVTEQTVIQNKTKMRSMEKWKKMKNTQHCVSWKHFWKRHYILEPVQVGCVFCLCFILLLVFFSDVLQNLTTIPNHWKLHHFNINLMSVEKYIFFRDKKMREQKYMHKVITAKEREKKAMNKITNIENIGIDSISTGGPFCNTSTRIYIRMAVYATSHFPNFIITTDASRLYCSRLLGLCGVFFSLSSLSLSPGTIRIGKFQAWQPVTFIICVGIKHTHSSVSERMEESNRHANRMRTIQEKYQKVRWSEEGKKHYQIWMKSIEWWKWYDSMEFRMVFGLNNDNCICVWTCVLRT